MAIVYLGIGSNLGNREENIQKALTLLQKNNIQILKTSSIIETDPVGGPPQGKFLNGVIKISTMLTPTDLLKLLKYIERSLGRYATGLNQPRPIDMDILLYNKIDLQTPELMIPHPRMLERDFVLTPLQEIEPGLVEELLHAHR